MEICDSGISVHVFTEIYKYVPMEYYSTLKRNTFKSVLMRQMNLEPIIQREVSQKEKEKYSIYVEFRKTVPMILHAGQQRRHI